MEGLLASLDGSKWSRSIDPGNLSGYMMFHAVNWEKSCGMGSSTHRLGFFFMSLALHVGSSIRVLSLTRMAFE
jgi:hypothetical protein